MLVVDGTFEEQIDELATFIDSLSTTETKVQETVQQAIEKDDKETAIKEVVDNSSVLNDASEKNFEASHSLLIHILLSAENLSTYLPTILTNFKKLPSQSSGANPSYNILTTLFNVSPAQYRLPVFKALLQLSLEHNLYDLISSKFQNVPTWLKEWNVDPVQAREIYELVAELELKNDNADGTTEHLIRAVETFQTDDDSEQLTTKAVNAALNQPSRFTVDDLLTLQPVRALESQSPDHFKLLNILAIGEFSDLKSFEDASGDFYSSNQVSKEIVENKVRILTIAALSARQDNRKLRYSDIEHALSIPASEVETWIIESIKSGLVEGKLSQPSQVFLVHRATYRTFEHDQWEEVSAKLAGWKESLQGILEVIDNVKNDINGGQQLTNGFAGSDVDGDEVRSQSSDIDSLDENAD